VGEKRGRFAVKKKRKKKTVGKGREEQSMCGGAVKAMALKWNDL